MCLFWIQVGLLSKSLKRVTLAVVAGAVDFWGVGLTYEVSGVSATPVDVWLNVGNQDVPYWSTSFLRDLGGFHTRQRVEVESFKVIPQPIDSGA